MLCNVCMAAMHGVTFIKLFAFAVNSISSQNQQQQQQQQQKPTK